MCVVLWYTINIVKWVYRIVIPLTLCVHARVRACVHAWYTINIVKCVCVRACVRVCVTPLTLLSMCACV